MTPLVGQLPPDVEERLKAAAQIPDPRERIRAIDQIQQEARRRYPRLFRKENDMAKVRIENVRMAFPAIFKAEAIGDGEPAFGARFIVPQNHPAVKLLDAAIVETARDKWGTKADQILAKLRKDGAICFVKEEYQNSDGEVYAGFENAYHLQTRSQVKPLVIDRDKTPLTERDGRPYSGCYVVAMVEVWAQENSFGRGVRAQLKGVQFYKDGEAFAGGTPASEGDFDDLSEGVEEDEDALA